MRENLTKLLEKLSIYKKELEGLRPLPPANLAKLKEYYAVEWTYNSNAIEGNTLTLGETKLVIFEGITIGGKSVKDHLEAINHKKAIDYLESIVDKTSELSEEVIKGLHTLILREIDDQNAGRYRDKQVYISGSRFIPPDPQQIPFLMPALVKDFNQLIMSEKPIMLKVSDLHYNFVKIHPFIDGNGRLARLLMNLFLIRDGYPPAIIPMSRREEYINALEDANRGDIEPFYLLVSECCEESLVRYLRAMR